MRVLLTNSPFQYYMTTAFFHPDWAALNLPQLAAMAAEGYSRFSEAGIGAVISTNAPGALNLLNGIDGCWNDSIPCIFICGQITRARWNRTKTERPGGREIVDIVTIAGPITKYARYVNDPNMIRYYLDEAVHIAREGRPGPVLLDIPLDVQKAQIEPLALQSFKPLYNIAPLAKTEELTEKVRSAIHIIRDARRPVVLLGGGLRLSGSITDARRLIEDLGVPAVAAWGGF